MGTGGAAGFDSLGLRPDGSPRLVKELRDTEILALMQVQMPQEEWNARMKQIVRQGSSSIHTKPGYDVPGITGGKSTPCRGSKPAELFRMQGQTVLLTKKCYVDEEPEDLQSDALATNTGFHRAQILAFHTIFTEVSKLAEKLEKVPFCKLLHHFGVEGRWLCEQLFAVMTEEGEGQSATFVDFMKSLSLFLPLALDVTAESKANRAYHLFRLIDVDGDGEVTMLEVLQFLSQPLDKNSQNLNMQETMTAMLKIEGFLVSCGCKPGRELLSSGISCARFVLEVSTTEYGWKMFPSFFSPIAGIQLKGTSVAQLRQYHRSMVTQSKHGVSLA